MPHRNDAVHREVLRYATDSLTQLRDGHLELRRRALRREGGRVLHPSPDPGRGRWIKVEEPSTFAWRSELDDFTAGGFVPDATAEELAVPDADPTAPPFAQRMPPFEAYRYGEALREDPTIASHFNRRVGDAIHTPFLGDEGWVLSRFGHRLLERQGHFGVDPEAFEREYAAMEAAFYTPTIRRVWVAPLWGLAMDAERVELEPGLEIAALTEDEMLFCLDSGVFEVDGQRRITPRFGIRRTYEIPKIVGEATEQQRAEASRALDRSGSSWLIERLPIALSALCPGHCSVQVSWHGRDSWFFDRGPSDLDGTWRLHAPWNPQRLDADAIAQLPELWHQVRDLDTKHHAYLDQAMRRLYYAAERRRPQDRLVDLMIAAEALFLSDVPREGEKTYRLSTRAGLFLGTLGLDAYAAFRDVKKAYGLRSGVVHGGEASSEVALATGQVVTLSEFGGRIEEYLRLAIRELLRLASRPEAPKQLVDWDGLTFRAQSAAADAEEEGE